MRPRGGRRHRQVPSARRPGRLRRPRAPRPGFRPALSAGRRPGQLRQHRRRQCRCLPLHRGAAVAHGHRLARGHRRGDRRFPRLLQRRGHRAGRPARQFPEPAGERLCRHRRGHGDQHSPAQRGGALQRRAAPHQASQRHHRQAGRVRARAGLSDRRHHRRAARVDPGGLQDRPRRLPPAGALGEGGHRARRLPDRRHRSALPGTEGQAGRAHRRAVEREEAAPAGRRARRVRPRPCGWCSSPRPAQSTPSC